jgi:hypothetical protein
MSYSLTRGYGETDASGNLILVPDEPGPPNPNPPQPIFVPGEAGPGCGPGEEFDLTSMQCVTAGQAVTPVLPPEPASFVPSGGGGGGSETGIPFVKSSMVPWLIGGGLAIGAVALLASLFAKPARARPNRRRARHNPRRPPKKWFDDCVAGVEASGSAADPYAVCGALWHRKMGPKAKAAALRAERSR